MKDFFVSYNKADRPWAEWIAWELEAAGYTTVLQAWDFRPGSNFALEMQRAAAEAARTIAVLSPDYLTARFTRPEWAAAFVQDPTGEKGTLLPVRVRECDLEGLLSSIVYVDLVGREEAAAREALLAGVSREQARPTTPPGFPGAAPRPAAERPRFPGALPPIWNVPHLRNPHFTGRESLLTALRTGLTGGSPAALTQALGGLGGVGKTQLAVEYAYRHAADYAVVWWVRAEEPATLAADYASLAGPLGLPEKDVTDQPAVVQAVRRWLGQNPGWLLVFDNAQDPTALHGYLPQGGTGHVLITSRSPTWGRVARPLSVPVLERAEAVGFLRRRTGEDDEAAASALAEALGDLPLALEQAAAYVEATGRSLSDYLNLFRVRQRDLLSRGSPSDDYPATVATTWEISFQQVRQASPAGADLLNLCAFLAPDDIPRDLLSEGAEYLPEPLSAVVADHLAFDDAMVALRRYSLVAVSGDALSVHRLVQVVARDRLKEDGQRTWAEAAVCLVNGAFPSVDDPMDVRPWPKCSRLLPHALAVAGHAEALQVAPEAMGRLLNEAGMYLLGRAEFAKAKAAFERSLAFVKVAFGPDHPEVAIRFSNLGRVLREQGDLAGAWDHYEQALVLGEVALGPDHPTVAIRINNLGRVLQLQGDLVGALGHFKRALAIDEAAYGPNHPAVARDVNNVGGVLYDQGDLVGARAHFERALAIDEAAYGSNDPRVALHLSNIGHVLQEQGDLAMARTHFERAMAIDKATYGPNHPYVASDVNHIGEVLREQGDLVGARACFERALEILREFLGEDHPNTVKVRNNLGSLNQEFGDPR